VISGQEKKTEDIDRQTLYKSVGFELFEGLKMGVGGTFVAQRTFNTNSSANDDVTDVTASIDIEFQKQIGSEGLAFLHLEAGEGQGVEASGRLDVFSNANGDVNNTFKDVELSEIWYEHKFFDEFYEEKIRVVAGKLDPTLYLDENAYANDETRQFLGRIFVNNPVVEFSNDTIGADLAKNNPVVNGPGIRVWFSAKEWLEFSGGLFDGDADWGDVMGTPFTFVQANLKPNLFDKEGNYRAYFWFNNKDHIALTDTTKVEESGYGLGFSFDQELTDDIGGFFRFGWQNEEVHNIALSWSFGAQIFGKSWGREKDVLGLAFGQLVPGGDYEDAAAGRNADVEGHFEAYYSFYVNDSLTLSPDLQIIWNPKGNDPSNPGSTEKVITVLGLRAQLSF